MSYGYVSEVKKITNDEIVINVDDTDIAKPYATKLEYLDKVIDGSSKDKKIINGYKVLEMTTLEFAKIINKDAIFLLYRMSRGISEILSKSRSSLLRYI